MLWDAGSNRLFSAPQQGLVLASCSLSASALSVGHPPLPLHLERCGLIRLLQVDLVRAFHSWLAASQSPVVHPCNDRPSVFRSLLQRPISRMARAVQSPSNVVALSSVLRCSVRSLPARGTDAAPHTQNSPDKLSWQSFSMGAPRLSQLLTGFLAGTCPFPV